MTPKTPVVYTNTAKCRDCYRCVRVCPVNAIKIKNGQAQVMPENCISCGTCITECPQNAKTYRKEVQKVVEFLDEKRNVAISIAPSFASVYPEWSRARLASALRIAGFTYVSETAIGAYIMAHETKLYINSHSDMSHICTACPAIVNFVEKYSHKHVNNLTPIASPMIIHARKLKKEQNISKVVFVGPCIAKKSEEDREENKNDIDAVLTFDELDELFKMKNINLQECEESSFDEEPGKDARLFPIEGGLLKTIGIDGSSENHLALSGFEEFKDSLIAIEDEQLVIEPLFCKHGCVNGPIIAKNKSRIKHRNEIVDYNRNNPANDSDTEEYDNLSSANYRAKYILGNKEVTEEQIKEVLAKTGKYKKSDELNCGACGYNSCRDKAVAVIQGIAELEMCMPYMRKRAEQKTDLIVERDPNGFLILDENLNIQSMNSAFKNMFTCSDNLIGKQVSYLIDPDPFEQLLTGKETIIKKEIKYPSYSLICHLVVYSIPEQKQYVGVFVDITDTVKSHDKLKNIKAETIAQVHELIEHQINMSQEMARFLGDNTAKGEILMQKLIDAIEE